MVNVLWIIFNIIIVSVRCVPFSKNWRITEPGKCLPQVPIVPTVAAWGLAIDLAIWSLPVPASWRLQLPRSSKFALTLIFSLGILDIGVGVGRLVTILQVDEKDPTWSEAPALQWLAIEPSIAILVACMIVCRPLMEKLPPRSWRSAFSSKGQSGEDNLKLVNGKFGTAHRNKGIGGGSAEGSFTGSHTEQEKVPTTAIHVRKDFAVSADNRV